MNDYSKNVVKASSYTVFNQGKQRQFSGKIETAGADSYLKYGLNVRVLYQGNEGFEQEKDGVKVSF